MVEGSSDQSAATTRPEGAIRKLRRGLSVLVCDSDPKRSSIIESGLVVAGCLIVANCGTVRGLARVVEKCRPDLIVVGLSGTEQSIIEHLFQFTRVVDRPVIIFINHSDLETTDAAIRSGVAAYVVDGLSKERVKSVVELAICRFHAVSRLHLELNAARTALNERKLIERAKGRLMHHCNLSEAQAYETLRREAMNKKARLADIALQFISEAEPERLAEFARLANSFGQSAVDISSFAAAHNVNDGDWEV